MNQASIDMLVSVLREANRKGFTRHERHEAADVFRAAYFSDIGRRLINREEMAYNIAMNFIDEQYDKWQRHYYEVRDGRHRRPLESA